MVERRGHIEELQSMRGLAALTVAIGHTLAIYRQPDWLAQASAIFNGRFAVVLFFVLSGFVLTKSLSRFDGSVAALVTYWVRRATRIYPAIWIVSVFALIYIFVLRRPVPVPEGLSSYFLSRYAPERMRPLHLTASFAGGLAYLIPQLWSIFVELVASAALPLIAFVAYRRRPALVALLISALAVSYAVGARTYYHVGLYAFDFVLGAWLATLAEPLRRRAARLAPVGTPALGVLAVAALFTQFLPFDYYSATAALIEAALATAMIGLVVYGGAQSRWLASPAAVWLGDISYSVYLLHYLVASTLIYVIALGERATGTHLGSISKGVLLCAATIPLTLTLSVLTYNIVEKPGIRLGLLISDRISRRLGEPRPGRREALQAEVTPP